MALLSVGNFHPFDKIKHQKQSRQLDDFARGDFSSVAAELLSAYENTTGMQERYVPLVEHYVDELSGLYDAPVRRTWSAGAERFEAVYADSGLDAAFAEVEAVGRVQRTALCLMLPDGIGKVRPLVLRPWQVEIDCGDPMRADDVQAADKVTIQVPQQVAAGQVIYGELVLTKSSIYREMRAERLPVYGESIANPFAGGRYPLAVLRVSKPELGRFFAPVNEPLLNLQVALCLQESDTEHLIRYQAYGQKVIEGASHAQAVDAVQVGPDKIWALVASDPTAQAPKLTIVGKDPPISQIVTWQESRIRLFANMLGISADAFLRVNTALTASARLFADQDRKAIRDKVRPKMVAFEQQALRAVADVVNLSAAGQVDTSRLSVDIRWSDNVPSVDPLHDAQATKMRIEQGLTSTPEIVAEDKGISRDAAMAVVQTNLAETAALADSETAGAVQDTALNGAQVTALADIVQRVAGGLLPGAAAEVMIAAAFPLLPDGAAATMVSAAAAFTVPPDASLPDVPGV